MKQQIGFGILALLFTVPFLQTAIAKKAHFPQFKAETGQLQGQIGIVQPQNHLVVVNKGAIPYDFKVTTKTKIMISGKRAKIQSLIADKGQSVTVKYRALRKGDIAREIDVGSEG